MTDLPTLLLATCAVGATCALVAAADARRRRWARRRHGPDRRRAAVPGPLPRWRRALGGAIDAYLCWAVATWAAIGVTGEARWSSPTAVAALAVGAAVALGSLAASTGATGRTPGKAVVGGRVVRWSVPHEPVGTARAAIRLLLAIVAPLGAGLSLGAPDRRAAHDHLTDTVVVAARRRADLVAPHADQRRAPLVPAALAPVAPVGGAPARVPGARR